MRIVGLGLAFSLALEPATLQQAEAPCRACAGTGHVACAGHPAEDLALERGVLACTFYAGCGVCAGTGRVDCPSCVLAQSASEPSQTLAARFERYAAIAGRPVLTAAGPGFSLVCELEPMRAEGRRRNRHQLLHLYLERLEALQRAYLAFFALAPGDLTARSEIFLWAKEEDHRRLGQELCGYETTDPEYMRGLEAIGSIWLDPKKMPDDAALHRNVVHLAVHGMMNVQEPVGYTGRLRMGWADEGLSLWFEDRLLGQTTGYCFWPDEVSRELKTGDWRPALRKRLDPEDALDLERLLTLDSIEMTREEQALGFALIDFLAARDAALLNRFLARLRARTPSRDAFMEIYGLTLERLEADWRAWVAKTYPRR